jgi:hypothetical protein
MWSSIEPCVIGERLKVRFATQPRSIENTDGSSTVMLSESRQGQNVIVTYPDLYQKDREEFEPCGRIMSELEKDRRGDTEAQLSTLTATLIHEVTHCVLKCKSIYGHILQLLLMTRCDSR